MGLLGVQNMRLTWHNACGCEPLYPCLAIIFLKVQHCNDVEIWFLCVCCLICGHFGIDYTNWEVLALLQMTNSFVFLSESNTHIEREICIWMTVRRTNSGWANNAARLHKFSFHYFHPHMMRAKHVKINNLERKKATTHIWNTMWNANSSLINKPSEKHYSANNQSRHFHANDLWTRWKKKSHKLLLWCQYSNEFRMKISVNVTKQHYRRSKPKIARCFHLFEHIFGVFI